MIPQNVYKHKIIDLLQNNSDFWRKKNLFGSSLTLFLSLEKFTDRLKTDFFHLFHSFLGQTSIFYANTSKVQ